MRRDQAGGGEAGYGDSQEVSKLGHLWLLPKVHQVCEDELSLGPGEMKGPGGHSR